MCVCVYALEYLLVLFLIGAVYSKGSITGRRSVGIRHDTEVIRAGHFTAMLRSRLMLIVMIVCVEHECACVRARASCDGVPCSGNVLTFKIGPHFCGRLPWTLEASLGCASRCSRIITSVSTGIAHAIRHAESSCLITYFVVLCKIFPAHFCFLYLIILLVESKTNWNCPFRCGVSRVPAYGIRLCWFDVLPGSSPAIGPDVRLWMLRRRGFSRTSNGISDDDESKELEKRLKSCGTYGHSLP